MPVATRDRGEIMHFAGLHALSPALRNGAPAFAPRGDTASARCGWAAFFEALRRLDLVLVYDREDPGSARFAPAREAKALRHEHASLRSALEHARRFLRALEGAGPPGDGA